MVLCFWPFCCCLVNFVLFSCQLHSCISLKGYYVQHPWYLGNIEIYLNSGALIFLHLEMRVWGPDWVGRVFVLHIPSLGLICLVSLACQERALSAEPEVSHENGQVWPQNQTEKRQRLERSPVIPVCKFLSLTMIKIQMNNTLYCLRA